MAALFRELRDRDSVHSYVQPTLSFAITGELKVWRENSATEPERRSARLPRWWFHMLVRPPPLSSLCNAGHFRESCVLLVGYGLESLRLTFFVQAFYVGGGCYVGPQLVCRLGHGHGA